MSKILVMMSTYNGSLYIKEQLDSVINQKEVDVDIFIRDDGSSDKTISIIKEYCKNCNNIHFEQGDNLKPSGSFMWLIQNSAIQNYDYFAFCDQDDVWLEDKLISAVKQIKDYDKIPVLYYCATCNVDKELNAIGLLYTDTVHTTSLLDSIATGSLIPGCTMVFNKELMHLLKQGNPCFVTMHDTWTHLICLSCGGTVIGDSTPHILYRQHENNVIGSMKKNVFERIARAKRIENKFSLMVSEIGKYYKSYMSKDNKEIINLVSNYKHNLLLKFKLILKIQRSSLSYSDKCFFILKIIYGCF